MAIPYSTTDLETIFKAGSAKVEEIKNDLARALYLFPMETINRGYFFGFLTAWSRSFTVVPNQIRRWEDSDDNYKYRGAGFFPYVFGNQVTYQAFSDFLDSVYMSDPDVMLIGADHVSRRYPVTAAAWLWSTSGCIFANDASPIPDIDVIGLKLIPDDNDPTTDGVEAPETTSFGIPENMTSTHELSDILPEVARILDFLGEDGSLGWPDYINYLNPYHPSYNDGTTPPSEPAEYTNGTYYPPETFTEPQ